MSYLLSLGSGRERMNFLIGYKGFALWERWNEEMKRRVVGIIPARMGSTRLPGKPLMLIEGRPLIQWVYEAAVDSGACDLVLVATDAEEIRQTVVGFGGNAELTSAAHPTGTDRLAEVAVKLRAEVILNIQGDEPFISQQTLRDLAREMKDDDKLLMATVATPINKADAEDPNIVKVVLDKDYNALYFSRALIPYMRNRDCNPSPVEYFKHIGLYAYRRDFLLKYQSLPRSPLEIAESLEQLRALYNGEIGRAHV